MFQSLVNSWGSGCDEAVLFHLCLVKAVSLLNICWPVHRRRSCFRNVKRLFAEPVRCCIRQSLCLSLRQIATSLEDSCSVLKYSVLLYTPSASETRRETEKKKNRNKMFAEAGTLREKILNRSVIMNCLKHSIWTQTESFDLYWVHF